MDTVAVRLALSRDLSRTLNRLSPESESLSRRTSLAAKLSHSVWRRMTTWKARLAAKSKAGESLLSVGLSRFPCSRYPGVQEMMSPSYFPLTVIDTPVGEDQRQH